MGYYWTDNCKWKTAALTAKSVSVELSLPQILHPDSNLGIKELPDKYVFELRT
jgi:hypothetical protein